MKSIWIIGDVHGCIKTLKSLIERLPTDTSIVFVGDLIDRGSKSKEVVEFVRSNNYPCVKGNHELSMVDALPKILKDKSKIDSFNWTQINGGRETMDSYGLTNFISPPLSQVIDDMRWIDKLPLYLEFPKIKDKQGRYPVVSHAPFGRTWSYRNFPKKSVEYRKFMTNVLFNRDSTIEDNNDIFNIFGHTPVNIPIVTNHYANIDTGVCYTDGSELGVLTALEFPSLDIVTQKNID